MNFHEGIRAIHDPQIVQCVKHNAIEQRGNHGDQAVLLPDLPQQRQGRDRQDRTQQMLEQAVALQQEELRMPVPWDQDADRYEEGNGGKAARKLNRRL